MAAATVAVVGGAGAMGRIAVRDLVETAGPDVRVVVADRDGDVAAALARRLRAGRRVHAVEVDARRPAETARRLAGAFAIVNCCPHDFNLPVMEAALRAGAHYCDLGGLFHVTRAQLKLDRRFRDAGLLALVGIGAAPGIVNVLARAAADEMDRVDEIHILVGGADRTPGRDPGVLAASYSIQTILDEASLPAAVFTGGRFAFVEPMSDPWPVRFPAPIGLRHPARTLHSEVATLPLSFRAKGIREVSFRIAFPDVLADAAAVPARARAHGRGADPRAGCRGRAAGRAHRAARAPAAVRPRRAARRARGAAGGGPRRAARPPRRGGCRLPHRRHRGLERRGRRRHRLPAVDRRSVAPDGRHHGARRAAARAGDPAGAVLRGAAPARDDDPPPAPSMSRAAAAHSGVSVDRPHRART